MLKTNRYKCLYLLFNKVSVYAIVGTVRKQKALKINNNNNNTTNNNNNNNVRIRFSVKKEGRKFII